MISYDDLVVALAAWRARQGLPVVQVAGASPSSALSSSTRAAPPGPPRVADRAVEHELDDAALVESYDAGDDYVTGVDHDRDSTGVGAPPEPVTDGLLVPKRKRDW
jgi:hypothetical protein